ncbi:MAG: aminomethyl-transferring glycine dehydrogenase, partial [Lachnospiraceae bacterium]|nr:aminomethyl-transferring glycine dehydrogenase [Lachnospiraceae bacterium]
MGSYVPNTLQEQREMLHSIGRKQVEDLFTSIPEKVRLNRELNLPSGLSEMEVTNKIREIAGKNRVFKTIFRGAGAYRHYIPSIVKQITSKEEFVTAYTPYQA